MLYQVVRRNPNISYPPLKPKLPRRIPLLGLNDPNSVKRIRAFTIQAQQEIWDIGQPQVRRAKKTGVKQPKRTTLPRIGASDSSGIICWTPQDQMIKMRPFYTAHLRGNLPFTQDHSSRLMYMRVAWHQEIQCINLKEIMPLCVGGLCDPEPQLRSLAYVALLDIIRHCYPETIIPLMPFLSQIMVTAVKCNKEEHIRQIVKFLTHLVHTIPGCVMTLVPHMTDIFSRFYRILTQRTYRNQHCSDQIDYSQRNKPTTNQLVNDFITTLINVSRDTADSNMDWEIHLLLRRAFPDHA